MDGRNARGLRHDARSRISARFCRGESRAASSGSLTTLRLTVEYDGTDFFGFQWQPHSRTVAGTLEDALSTLFGGAVKVTGAGRTDRGVHASGQVVSVVTETAFPFERLLIALRGLLPADCSVVRSELVEDGFSARFSALERTYCYAILNRPAAGALLARYAYLVPGALDLRAMQDAAEHLIGRHDFCAFATTPPGTPTVRDVRHLQIERRRELVRVEIRADGFLHHMVRTIVGTLVGCGTGRRSPEEVPAILAARDRARADPAAPAHGLYLAGVRYPDGYDSFAEPPILDAAPAFP